MDHVIDSLVLYTLENGSLTWYAKYFQSRQLILNLLLLQCSYCVVDDFLAYDAS